MNIRLLAFASAAETLGSAQQSFALPSSEGVPTVRELKAALTAQHPDLEILWERLAVSVNGTVVSDAEKLSEGDEVALLPPVSGG